MRRFVEGTLIVLALAFDAAFVCGLARERARMETELARTWEEHQPRASQLFGELNTDHDGLLTAEELRNADLGGQLSAADKEIVHFMRLHIDNIGHRTAEIHGGLVNQVVWAISRVDLHRSRPGQFHHCYICEEDLD